jgi:hypothetical protein
MRGCGNLHSAGGALPECNYGYRTLSEKKLAGILRTLPKRPLLAGDEGIRLSLASAQDKVGCASRTAKSPSRSAARRARIRTRANVKIGLSSPYAYAVNCFR